MGAKLHQFFMSSDTARYIFKSGKIAHFLGGVYRTTIESEVKELNDEIAAGIGAIWVVAGQEVVDADDIDPVAVFKRKVIADYEAEKARANNNGESTSDQSRGVIAGSNAVGTAATSNSGGGAAGVAKNVALGSIKVGKSS